MERTECLINLSNLLYNYHQILKYTNKKVIGVIKADAYGHGAFEVAQVLEKENISYHTHDITKFSKDKDIELEKLIFGSCIPKANNGSPKILIPNNGLLSDSVTLVHELSHYRNYPWSSWCEIRPGRNLLSPSCTACRRENITSTPARRTSGLATRPRATPPTWVRRSCWPIRRCRPICQCAARR